MATEIKEQKEVTLWVCDVCGLPHDWKWSAERCEQLHKRETCQHETLKYQLFECDISSMCATCGKDMEEARFDDLGSDQDLMRKVFAVLKEHKAKGAS